MNQNLLTRPNFPVGMDCQWQQRDAFGSIEPCLNNWLLDTQSLTERLEANCREFSLTLLGQAPSTLHANEELSLANQPERCQVREVILSGDGVPWVFARSILPGAIMHEGVAKIGDKPLGKVLFNDSAFKRQPFEICQLAPQHKILQDLQLNSVFPLWGRRSTFTYQTHNIMVAELFLPACPAYKNV